MQLIDLAEQIKTRRRELGLTQGELAKRAGVSRIHIDRIENARAADVGFRGLLRVLNAIRLDLRLTELNQRRPTLDDLRAENEDE